MRDEQYLICRITDVNEYLEAEIRELMKILEDPECSIDGYMYYFKNSTDKIGLHCAFYKGNLVGLIFGQAPIRTYPNRGYMPITAVYPTVPQKITKQLFDMTVDWCKDNGAKYIWGWTKRSPRVLKRLYGYEVVKEHQIIVPIEGFDEHLNVERDPAYADHND